jgi:uncharacterized coiled-coil DUF342 family protein
MMDNEKFFNYYVENLTNALNETINKNIVLQTQQRITGDENSAYVSRIEELSKLEEVKYLYDTQSIELQRLVSENEALRIELNTFKNASDEIARYKNENSVLLAENDNLRLSSSHIETFRNELLNARKKLDDSKKEIDILKKKEESLKIELSELKKKNKEEIKKVSVSSDKKPTTKKTEIKLEENDDF